MSDRAVYTRRAENSSFMYTLVSVNASALTGAEIGMSSASTALLIVFGGFVAVSVAGTIATLFQSLVVLVVILGFYGYLAYRFAKWRKKGFEAKVVKILGRRGTSDISLRFDALEARFHSGKSKPTSEQIPLSDIRRLRMSNTLDKVDIRSEETAKLAVAIAAPTWQRTGALLGAQAIGQARTAKARLFCFAVAIDYANTSMTLADGLDEVTARNFFEDLSKDYSIVSAT